MLLPDRFVASIYKCRKSGVLPEVPTSRLQSNIYTPEHTLYIWTPYISSTHPTGIYICATGRTARQKKLQKAIVVKPSCTNCHRLHLIASQYTLVATNGPLTATFERSRVHPALGDIRHQKHEVDPALVSLQRKRSALSHSIALVMLTCPVGSPPIHSMNNK